MMVNEFAYRNFTCAPPSTPGGQCSCIYDSALASECKIDGTAVLNNYGYKKGLTGTWVGIMIGIIAGYRLLGWLVLWIRKQ